MWPRPGDWISQCCRARKGGACRCGRGRSRPGDGISQCGRARNSGACRCGRGGSIGPGLGSANAVEAAPGPGMGRAIEAYGLWARGRDEPQKHEASGPGMGRATEARGSGPGDGTSYRSTRLRARGWDEPEKHEAPGPRAGRATEASAACAQRREGSRSPQRIVSSPRTQERNAGLSRLRAEAALPLSHQTAASMNATQALAA